MRAARHEDGLGMERGVDRHSTLQWHSALLRQHRFSEAGMLMTILCGACWGEARRYDAGYRTDNICQACHRDEDTDLHRAWCCKWYNECFDHKAVADSNYIKEEAMQRMEIHPCLFNRGVMPAECTLRPAPDDGPEYAVRQLSLIHI